MHGLVFLTSDVYIVIYIIMYLNVLIHAYAEHLAFNWKQTGTHTELFIDIMISKNKDI